MLQRDVLCDDVAALAALPRDGHGLVRGLVRLVRDHGRIFRLIQRIAWVVEHAPVHRDVLFHAGEILYGAHRIESDARFAHYAPAGLHDDERLFQPVFGGFFAHAARDALHRIGIAARGELRILVRIVDAVAAARVQDVAHDALVRELFHEADGDVDGLVVRGMVVDLRADVHVQAAEIQVLPRRDAADDLERVAVHVKAEFAERRCRHHRLESMGGNAGVHSHQHVLLFAEFPRLFVDEVDLVKAVDDKEAYAVGHAFRHLFRGLVVAVEEDVTEVRPRALHHLELPARDDVEPQPVRRGELSRRYGGERLVGKGDRALAPFGYCGDECVAHLGYVPRVHDVERSAESCRKLRRPEPADIKVAVFHIECFACVHLLLQSCIDYHKRREKSNAERVYTPHPAINFKRIAKERTAPARRPHGVLIRAVSRCAGKDPIWRRVRRPPRRRGQTPSPPCRPRRDSLCRRRHPFLRALSLCRGARA